MKKPVLIVFAIFLLAFISVYFIIPQKIKTSKAIEIDATDVNVSKFLVNKKAWSKWWPGSRPNIDSFSFKFNNVDYMLLQSTNDEMRLDIKQKDIEQSSVVTYAATGDGICKVTWLAEKQSSLNPFKRIAECIKVKHTATDIEAILKAFKKFMETDTNVYGLKIKIEKVKYPIVLASTINTKDYPSPAVVYNLVNTLKKYAQSKGAVILDSAMLNIHPNETNGYQAMVAIPVSKAIQPGVNMVINKLVKGGNLLEADIKGGKTTILNTFAQLKLYQKAHHLISPAMPYELLTTNRMAEKDTAKWLTKIYWPIF
jgi:effector-binding domain-containing protein